MQHVWVRGEVHRVWWEDLRERDLFKDLSVDGRIIEQERQCTYNVTLRSVRVTIAAVEKQ
jgi:hypothetical protein